ncbi:uncharacterized protein LOC128884142 isoform X2 [Hylaeus volcanicus]|nr:uncharacterized protein LOC128884142 isoform X2 [Hylaeus volcanicus]
MLALIRFCQSLLHTLAIKGCYPKTSDLRHYEKSLPEILTSRIKHALWDSPFILFAPLMSDGKRLDFNYIATYLKIIFLSFPSSKHSFLSKNTTNPTFYQYWLSSNQAFQSFIKRIPGVVTPFQNTQCGINVLLNQISVQTAHLFLTKKKLKQKDSIDHNDRDIDKKYVIDLNLDNNRPLYDHISDVVTLFERRQLESPVIRLTHDPSCQHRFAQLQGITLNYFPDNFYPNNSEVSLTKMYQLDRSLLKNMDEAKAAKIPILVGLRLQQGSHNIFINKTLSRTKKSKLDSYYDSRLTSLLPLTTPMFQQLTWMSCVMYKLDLWSKQYELTKKLETQMNVLALIIQKYLQFHLQKKLNIKPIILNERLVSLAMTAPSSRVLNEEVDYKTPWGRSDMDNALTLNERDSEENFTRNDYTENTWMKYCHKDPHSQRIEFLGDSVLKCITTIFFFFLGVSLDEGELTDRAHFIQANKFLKHCSENMNLHSYIAASVFMSRNAFFTGPTTITMMRRQVLSNKMQADAVEALIAAIYLSSICVEKETVSILPFSCVSESFYEELEFNCLLAGSIGKFNDGLKASVILLDILTLQEDNAIVPFSFGALWYTILNFNLNKKISSVCTQVKNCPSNLFLEKDQNNFPEFLNEKMNSKFIKTISHTYHFYISYKKIIDDSFIKEFSFNFPTHAPPVTNKQLTHLWNQQYAQEPLNKFSGIVTIARTHRSIASHMDLTHSYEQLEYLGDGVLSLLITDYLYKEFPLYDEGMLSNCKSLLQSNIFLAIRFLRKLVTHNEQVNISVIPASGILLCLLDDSFDMMENFVTQLITIPLQDDPMIAFYLQKYYITLANPDAKTKPSQTIHNYIDIASLPTLQQMKRIADVYESLLGATFLVTSCNLEHCWNCIQDDFNSVREFLVSKVFRNMT